MPRAFPFLSIADEKLEGFINSVASGEASRLCEQRDPGEIGMHPGPCITGKKKVGGEGTVNNYVGRIMTEIWRGN